jgi:hypothetical protein
MKRMVELEVRALDQLRNRRRAKAYALNAVRAIGVDERDPELGMLGPEVGRLFRRRVRPHPSYIAVARSALLLRPRRHRDPFVVAMTLRAAGVPELPSLRARELGGGNVLPDRLVTGDARHIADLDEWKRVAGEAVGAERLVAL